MHEQEGQSPSRVLWIVPEGQSLSSGTVGLKLAVFVLYEDGGFQAGINACLSCSKSLAGALCSPSQTGCKDAAPAPRLATSYGWWCSEELKISFNGNFGMRLWSFVVAVLWLGRESWGCQLSERLLLGCHFLGLSGLSLEQENQWVVYFLLLWIVSIR